MDFNPKNPIIQLCLKGMALESTNKIEALRTFMEAWDSSTNDFERFLSAYYIAHCQPTLTLELEWYNRTLELALSVNTFATSPALPGIYSHLARVYHAMGDEAKSAEMYAIAEKHRVNPQDPGPFYHGTRADLHVGHFLTPGGISNYKSDLKMNHIYFTSIVDGAGLAAALANGDKVERVYIIEPTGDFEHDPNVTDLKFPGNPTRSYRSTSPLKIVGEISDWNRISTEEIEQWKAKLAQNKGDIIN